VEFVEFAIYGILGLLALITLFELGLIKVPSKRTRVSPRRLEKWIAEFPSGIYRRIEWRELFNGQWHWKFKGHPYTIALTPFVDIKPVSVTPDSGKMLFKVLVEFDGFKSYAQPVYDKINEGKDLSQKDFYKTKKTERTQNALEENQSKPETSIEKTVSDAMDEDYAENTFMEKVKIAEAQKPKTKIVKQKTKSPIGEEKND